MPRPSFLGLGALKAATTLLHALLDAHPSISMARGMKEVRFFNLHYERGLGWYEGLFQPGPGQISGEVSPDYLYDPRCAPRIAEAVPEARLIAILRDPVTRTWSQYLHFRRERYYRGDFDRFLDEHPNALERNLYHQQLSRYLDLFPRERVKILLFEPFTADPTAAIGEVYDFLGVDPAFIPPPEGKVNASTAPRFPWIYATGSRGMAWLRGHGLGPLADGIKATGVKSLMLGGRADKRPAPTLSAAQEARIAAHCAKDLSALEALLGRPIREEVWPLTLKGSGVTGS